MSKDDKTIFTIVGTFVLLLTIATLFVFASSGLAKQGLIFEKTGRQVSFIKALGYPDCYFADGLEIK